MPLRQRHGIVPTFDQAVRDSRRDVLVEQERNGLLTFDRRPKAEVDRLRSATETAKRR